MKKILIIILAASAVFTPPLHAQRRGDLIGPIGDPGKNPGSTGSKTNLVADSPTNSVDGIIVGFDKLAGFPILLTDDLAVNTNRPAWADGQINAMLPSRITALDKQRVTVEGFMIPLEFKGTKVVEFLLSRNPPACCYGSLPQIHELIRVQPKFPGVKPMEFGVVRVTGILRVGAERREGILTTIYRMDAETVVLAPGN
jgi:hypothetical protein